METAASGADSAELTEIVAALHFDLAEWLGTDAPPKVFDRISGALDERFTSVVTTGQAVDRETFLAGIWSARNALAGLQIEVSEAQELARSGQLILVRFVAENRLGTVRMQQRTVTAALVTDGRTHLWRTVHETALPEPPRAAPAETATPAAPEAAPVVDPPTSTLPESVASAGSGTATVIDQEMAVATAPEADVVPEAVAVSDVVGAFDATIAAAALGDSAVQAVSATAADESEPESELSAGSAGGEQESVPGADETEGGAVVGEPGVWEKSADLG